MEKKKNGIAQTTTTRFNNSNYAEREEKEKKIERLIKPYIRPTHSQHSHNKTQKTLTRTFQQHTSIFASEVQRG